MSAIQKIRERIRLSELTHDNLQTVKIPQIENYKPKEFSNDRVTLREQLNINTIKGNKNIHRFRGRIPDNMYDLAQK